MRVGKTDEPNKSVYKSPHMRWSRTGTYGVVQLRVALLNQKFHDLAQQPSTFCVQMPVSAV
jgi:hypothetical protein